MPKYVAFLRAINVGGRIVKMDYLRDLFAALGFANVETLIASGNVIFSSASKNTKGLEQKIEIHLHETLGYKVATFVRSTSELALIARYKPFADSELNAEGHTLYIGFLSAKPVDEAKQKMAAHRTEVDEFHFHGREIYWLCRKKFSETQFKGNLEKLLGMQATLRNSTTVKKIAVKYS